MRARGRIVLATKGLLRDRLRGSLATLSVALEDGAEPAEDAVVVTEEVDRADHPALVVATRATDHEQLRRVFAAGHRHVLGVDPDGGFDGHWLRVVVTTLLTGGGAPDLAESAESGAESEAISVVSSEEAARAVDAAQSFTMRQGGSSRLAGGFASIVDELVSNALYDAPVDAAGLPRFASFPRSRPVTLAPSERIDVRFYRTADRLEVVVTDPFGQLRAAHVLSHLVRCLARGEDQVDRKEGGAGLGLYTVFTLANTLVVAIEPGRRTQVLASSTRSRYGAIARAARSLFIFGDAS